MKLDRRHLDLLLLAVLPVVALAATRLTMVALHMPGWDDPAHLYKLALLRHGQSVFWDNYWYGGSYGAVEYGVVYYWLAQYVGAHTLAILSGGLMPVLFYLYLKRVWGVERTLPAWVLAIVMCPYLANGQDPFVFAVAVMLAALVLLGWGRPLPAALAAAVALFANPLAVVLGGVFMLAESLARPETRRRYLLFALWFSPFALAKLALLVIFREPSTYVNDWRQTLGLVSFGLAGFVFARWSDDRRRGFKQVFFLMYAAFCALSYVLPFSPLGTNSGRLYMLFGLSLLLAVNCVRVPRAIFVVVIAGAVFSQFWPPVYHFIDRSNLAATRPGFFAGALAEASALYDPSYRFHVVAPQRHWEAYYFPTHGYPITRGWYRQADAIHNSIFYEHYTAADYIAWLHSMGVEYVFWPHTKLDLWSRPEPAILAGSGRFTVVYRDHDWTVYRLNDPRPLVEAYDAATRAAAAGRPAVMIGYANRGLLMRVPAPGAYLVKVSWSPFWRVTPVGLPAGVTRPSLARDGDDFLVLHAPAAGLYRVRFPVTLEALWDRFFESLTARR